MSQQNQQSQKIIALVGAICGSMLFGIPAIAQNPSTPYNGNGELRPNNGPSPDRNNPGVNQAPENRLTPTSPSSGNNSGTYQSPDSSTSPSNSDSRSQQQYPNSDSGSRSNSNRMRMNSSTGSSALNPCPSIFYESKYKDTVGLPAGCPATSGTSSAPQ